MKLKIKLRENKLNEAIETPGIDATAEREAEKVSNEFDAEDMDKEIEGQVDRDENREKLKAIAKKNPFTLPAIAKLLQAHNIAVNNQYKFDYLFEVIKLILSDETSVNSIKTKLGLDLKFILAVDINAADSLESWNEDEIQRNLLSQAVPSTTNEVLDNNDAAMVKKLRDAAGEMSDEEWYKTAVKYIKPKTKKEVVVINDINGLVNKLPGLANSFDEELEEAIEAKAKEGDDPLEILLGPTKDGKLLNNIKSIYIITRILEQFAILAKKHFRATADAASAVDKAADPKYSVDQWTDASENYSEAYRAFTPRLKHVINAASEKFNERIVNLAISGQGLAIARQSGHKQGAGKAVLDKRVKADQAGDYVGVTESLISETEKAEDLNTFYALALYKNKSIEDIEALTSKIKRKDPESIQKQLFRIIEYFERVFEQKLRDVLVKLNKLKGKPAFAERPDIINKIDALTNKFENDGDKDNFKKEFITVNKLMSTDPKSWNEQFKALLKNIEKYPNQLMKQDSAKKEKTAADPNSLKNMPQNKINAAMNFLRQQSGLPGGDLFAKQTAAAISTVSKNAGPQHRNFEERDVPVINKIKDELTKILSGDFSNLIKEGNLDSWNEETRNKLKSALKELVADKFVDDPEKAERLYKILDDATEGDRVITTISKALKPYIDMQDKGITYDIAVSEQPYNLANIKVANKIANQEELNKFEKQYYTNNVKEVEKELNKLNINELLLKEQCSINNNTNKDLSQLENIISQFYPYVKEKLKFNKDAKLNLISDPENAKDAWGKTAYYNPEAMEITVFVDNRHPKDMLRSISHELVHHSQNCRGEFDQTQALEPGYAQNDPHMRRMEGEAYLLGNGFLVRDFEDYLKSQQNQNLTENKKMKGLTNEQLKTVLENTIKRVMKEGRDTGDWCADKGGHFDPNTGDCVYEETVNEEEVVEEMFDVMDAPANRDDDVVEEGEEVVEELNETYETKMSCEMKGGTWEASDEGPSFGKCNHNVNETFTSKKDQLLFEKLTKIWTK